MRFRLLQMIGMVAIILSLLSSPTITLADNGDAQTGAGEIHPVKVVTSRSFTIALDANGTVWTWGHNPYGQLGTGDSADRSYPVQVAINGAPIITDIAAGVDYTMALDSQGRVWMWGELDSQANNTVMGSPTLVNGLSDVRQIAAGPTTAMALTANGQVMTWGSNYNGELGQGSQASASFTPSPVVIDENDTILTGIKQIAKGQLASYALKDDGTVYQWGRIDLQHSASVATSVDGITGAKAIESNANAVFVYAVTNNGVFAWGQNSYGQLGTGETRDSDTPVRVSSLDGKNVTSLSVGKSHVLALLNDGSVWGTGDTTQGQLADPKIYWQTTEFKPITTVSDVRAVYAGFNNSFFFKRDGSVVASGLNSDYPSQTYGLLGIGHTVDLVRVPVPMIALAPSYEVGPKPLNNVAIQVVNNDQLKFTYDIPALSNFNKIYFDVYPQAGGAAIRTGTIDYYSWEDIVGVTNTLDGHFQPGKYIVKIHTGNTGDQTVSPTVTYDNNAAGYTIVPGTVTLKVAVKEWNAVVPAGLSDANSDNGTLYNVPASGVTVTIEDAADFRNSRTAVTSENGVAQFDHLYPGLYKVEITDGSDGERSNFIVKDEVFVFGSQVSHTLNTIADSQPSKFIYQPDASTPRGQVGGNLSWYPPSAPSQTTAYRFYFEDAHGNKLGDSLGETPHYPAWTNYYSDVQETDIPAGAVAIRLYTFDGVSEHMTPNFVTLWNESMMPADAVMQSTDPTGNNLSGTIQWSAADEEEGIASYVIMPDFTAVDGSNERNESRIAVIPATGAKTYSYALSDFMLLDDWNSPPSANAYMIGVQNAMGQLSGYLNSNQDFVPYAKGVAIHPYKPDSGSVPGVGTGGAVQPESDGSVVVNPTILTDSSGRKVAQATITASQIFAALEHLPSTADPNQVILQIPFDGWDDFELLLEAELFRKLLDRNPAIVLVIQSKFSAIQFSASTVQRSLDQFGVSLAGAHVKLRMSKQSTLNEKLLQSLGLSSVTTPIDYKMSLIEKSGVSRNLNGWDSYTTYFLPVPSSLNDTGFEQLAGVAVDPATGVYYPVPTVFARDATGKVQAQIYGRNNVVYTVVANSRTFSDIGSSYAKEAITVLASKYVLNGYADGSFKPMKRVTRAEFVSMLTRALGIVPYGASLSSFTDVRPEDWFSPAVEAAVKARLVSGYSDGSFKPNAEISRMEMLQMIYNASRSSGKWKITLSGEEIDSLLARYADHDKVSAWAKEAMAAMIKAGIVNGSEDGRLTPGTDADRAQSASFLYRMLKTIHFIN
ncbi:S-layer homology domain-containing protein [Cohnella soli]|uniref:S-layer homology domain-containing protein n=1 Tax=Cohnella soli TaxID=425005 RepID=A0ABW0HND5_9BACL